MGERPSWDEYFMKIAADVATRATCVRRKVGAVIVKDKWIISTGTRGPCRDTHCTKSRALRTHGTMCVGERYELYRRPHSEQKRDHQAALHGVSINHAVIYITNQPCSMLRKNVTSPLASEFIYQSRI
jgi:dCMP deaminase